ncbi:MAG: hypothetical protein ABSA41_21045 [Terriglobia bacterium]|jgi:hypothetical protein
MSQLRPLGRLAFSALVFVTLARISPDTVHAQDEGSQPPPTPQEAQLHHDAPTVMDWTPEQIRARPELQHLQMAEDQAELPAILQEVGKRVARFFDDFPNTTCTEEVLSELCWAAGRECGVTFEGKFRYLLLARQAEGGQIMTEYRTDAKGRPIDYRRLQPGQILTSGFVGASLQHFDPQIQKASRFRYFGRQSVNRKEAEVVGFAEIPGKYPHPIDFRQENGVVLLFVQGLAWIDATTYQILRFQTHLLAPRPDVGLERLETRIEFHAIRLPETSNAFWLPTKVVVEAWLNHQHFRNTHRYSDFKLFRVESRIGPVVEK